MSCAAFAECLRIVCTSNDEDASEGSDFLVAVLMDFIKQQ